MKKEKLLTQMMEKFRSRHRWIQHQDPTKFNDSSFLLTQVHRSGISPSSDMIDSISLQIVAE